MRRMWAMLMVVAGLAGGCDYQLGGPPSAERGRAALHGSYGVAGPEVPNLPGPPAPAEPQKGKH